MPKRIISNNGRKNRITPNKDVNRKSPKKPISKSSKTVVRTKRNSNNQIDRLLNIKKINIKDVNVKNRDFKSINVKNINLKDLNLKNLNNLFISKKNIVTGATILATSVIGVVAINSLINSEDNVEAIEQVVLPERIMAGVSKEGQKYADDAKKVMEKLRTCQYRNDGKRVVYLTFDDGPSESSTKILDILDKNDVKATFFVTGQSIEHSGYKGKEILKRMYDSGNAIANHSYSHDYNILYPNRKLDLQSFLTDFNKTDELLKDALGQDFYTNVLRCPGGHMSWNGMEELDSYLKNNNMASIDWNALSGDAVGKNKTADDLFNEVVETSKGKEMIVLLMHDASSKEATVKSLQKIIDFYKDKGYEFRTLS